ncbi:bifunctional non-homologous end joining protein LigD [Caldanaerovirga acetigignens]|uniref:Bifunctional non-homologous end joining protein LigD n=1 Tax=Caldanaerovirga acetigignens TaxID=447595 RepID=A0A1M7J096_9FIRM|nr:non-homologous end-joining DNA ligase [Caldanaerovirga acetigignens]SHM46426.1 bifunctional non-homologous end joining protein LigD [Caldanaerovirga acetigignens]
MTVVSVGGEKLKLSNLSKLMWPEDGITKADIINYFVKIAPYLLPHLKDRPIVFTRYPEGIGGESFYQKNAPDYAPKWLKTYTVVTLSGGQKRKISYVLIDDLKSLVWAANQASLEIHPWLSRIGSIDHPDFAVFDLDPMEDTDFEDARFLALALKKLLEMEGFRSYPKTSGATGIQVYVPLEPCYTYRQVRTFAEFFCKVLEKTFPEKATTERNIAKRRGRVYLDYMQNVKGKTLIAPYCPRPLTGAPVSAPVTWGELESSVVPSMFTLKNMPERLKKTGDLFKGVLEERQRIDQWL